MIKKPWLTIIGINTDDINSLSEKAKQSLKKAELIIGAERHLQNFKLLKVDTCVWDMPFKKGLEKLFKHKGKKVVVLFSGNVFWYGAGSIIAENLDRNEWICYQSPSTFSLAAAKVGWAIQDTLCFGLHASPLETLRPYLAPKIKIIVLLKDGESVTSLGKWLTQEGFGKSDLFVMESLGFKNEKIRHTKANVLHFDNIKHPVCLAIIISGNGTVIPYSSGKPDFLFLNDGQITKQPIRALTISAMAPKPFEHLWDIGSGSGSISIEWLLASNTNTASAIEILSKRAEQIKSSAKKFGLDKLSVYNNDINEIIDTLQKPDVIFVGGGLTEQLLLRIWKLISSETRIIINSVTLETTSLLIEAHKKYGGSLHKFELSNITNLGKKRAWSKSYPIVQWVVKK
jgi:precorrin-6Y C5,15-methyltransferase (decarboxylating)